MFNSHVFLNRLLRDHKSFVSLSTPKAFPASDSRRARVWRWLFSMPSLAPTLQSVIWNNNKQPQTREKKAPPEIYYWEQCGYGQKEWGRREHFTSCTHHCNFQCQADSAQAFHTLIWSVRVVRAAWPHSGSGNLLRTTLALWITLLKNDWSHFKEKNRASA